MKKQTVIIISACNDDQLQLLANEHLRRYKEVEILNTNLSVIQKKDYDRETIYLVITIKYVP